MAVYFVVLNLQTGPAREVKEEYESAKLLEYEDSVNKYQGQNQMQADVLKVEAGTEAEARKAVDFWTGSSSSAPAVVEEVNWKVA